MSRAKFIEALKSNSLNSLMSIKKSDLHSHAGRGGTISYVEKLIKTKINPPTKPFDSLSDMDKWAKDNIKCHFPDNNGYLQRIAAAFVQAKEDNIAVLAMSYGVAEVYWLGGIEIFATIMNGLHSHFAPETKFLPDLILCYPDDLHSLDEIFSANWFKGIDIQNYSGLCTMNDLKAMCNKARTNNLILKAHVGEFNGADDIQRYAEELQLNQIQHGIRATESPQIMKWLAKHKIQLNVCPTSNIMLKNSANYKSHQIRQLYDHGIPITINSDDLLIFNASVSQEYLNLYNSGCMNAEELNIIRETGLLLVPHPV